MITDKKYDNNIDISGYIDYPIKRLSNYSFEDKIMVHHKLLHFIQGIYFKYYPKFADWYNTKVIPGFNKGTRPIYIITYNNEIFGVSISRISQRFEESNKISTFFLVPEATGNGWGSELLWLTLEELRTSRFHRNAIITVPEEKTEKGNDGRSFLGFLNNNRFKIVNRVYEKYREGKYEYILSRKLY